MPNYKLFFLIIFLSGSFFSCSISEKKIRKSKKTIYKSNQNLIDEINSQLMNLYIKNNKNDSLLLLLENKSSKYNELLYSINEKIKLLDSTVYSINDTYNNISSSLLLIEDNINILSRSYNEISQLEDGDDVQDIPPLNEQEFKSKYIESLASFQNGNWENSLKGFKYLLSLGINNNLLDNCQYWIGEIYFKLKEYHSSIKEFEKVFMYRDSNKRDDSLYKLSKCYMNLGNESKSDEMLLQLVEDFPNSEYVKKARELLLK